MDILVNNVGTNIRKPTIEYSEDEFERIMTTNWYCSFMNKSSVTPYITLNEPPCQLSLILH